MPWFCGRDASGWQSGSGESTVRLTAVRGLLSWMVPPVDDTEGGDERKWVQCCIDETKQRGSHGGSQRGTRFGFVYATFNPLPFISSLGVIHGRHHRRTTPAPSTIAITFSDASALPTLAPPLPAPFRHFNLTPRASSMVCSRSSVERHRRYASFARGAHPIPEITRAKSARLTAPYVDSLERGGLEKCSTSATLSCTDSTQAEKDAVTLSTRRVPSVVYVSTAFFLNSSKVLRFFVVFYGGPDALLFGRKIKSRFRPSRKIER
ncbi:hypothetical protein B0H13DRAFT_1903563 [Mycena leptocephala]|nr:hypothetical protein B0H13DRAFT_1903563 [Mycena leptocephala]